MKTDSNLISIIICTHNRCESLKDTIESILTQEHSSNYNSEIIIVDNNSKDKTEEVVGSYRQRCSGRLQYLFEQNQGLSYARNCGIKKAKGEIIVFSDDDCILDKQWIKNIVECFRNHNCDAVGGRVLPLYPDNTPKWVKENNNLLNGPIPLHDYGESLIAYTKVMLPFIGANMAFKRECFELAGTFRTDMGAGKGSAGEDTEFFRRLEIRQSKLIYCGQALVWHKIEKERINFKYLAKWFMSSGKYYALKELISKKVVICYFGIPRYLIRRIAKDLFSLIMNILSTRKLIMNMSSIFIDIGMISVYRKSDK